MLQQNGFKFALTLLLVLLAKDAWSFDGSIFPNMIDREDAVSCFSGSSNCDDCGDSLALFDVRRFSIGGWAEQGFTANFHSPSDRSNAPLRFNDRSNDYMLNQMYLFAEMPVRKDGTSWELGGRFDFNYGTDSRFLTVPGIEEHRDRTQKWNSENFNRGLAMPQAFVEIAAPWLHGVSLKAGHFYSIAGYETAAAPENFFYSHAYTYAYGEPITHSGGLLTVKPHRNVTFNVGYTAGWDVFDSSSNEEGFLGSITLSSSDRRTSLSATVHSGIDVTAVRRGGRLIDEARDFYSLVLQHQFSDRLRYVFQHDFGMQEDGQVVVNTGPRTITFDQAKWYGINQYLLYDVSESTRAGLRVEWFRDQDQFLLGVPVAFNPGGPTYLGGNYVGVTGGINWRPHPNVVIRPEVRWDYSDVRGNAAAPGGDPSFRAFNDNSSSSQLTTALDVILTL